MTLGEKIEDYKMNTLKAKIDESVAIHKGDFS